MRRFAAIAAALLASAPAAAWETQVLTVRGIQSITMSHEQDGVLVSFGCTRDPQTMNAGLTAPPPRVVVVTESTREFAAAPGDPGMIALSFDGFEQYQPASLSDNDSRATAMAADWPGLYRAVELMTAAGSITVSAWTNDQVVEMAATFGTSSASIPAKEFLDACS